MPTYQYRCTACGDELEVVQKFTDPSLTECPSCRGELRKIYNAVGVVFKGSGFYRTDSRSNGAQDASSDSATSQSSSSGSSSAGKTSSSTSSESSTSSSTSTSSTSTTSSNSGQ